MPAPPRLTKPRRTAARVAQALVVTLAMLNGACAARAEQPRRIRVAVYNIWELGADKLAEVDANGRGRHPQLLGASEVIQRIRPDIVLINEIDVVDGRPDHARQFQQRYLRHPQAGQDPIEYAHVFTAPVNTGLPTGRDLDRDGRTNGPGDAYGYGRYPGQYGMALLSRFPLDRAAVRTFQRLAWRSMPGHHMPDGKDGRPAWYDEGSAAIMRVSSKSHWDVPVRVGETAIHLICAHPTPPIFDGDEDRNGRRNFDEVRLIRDYIDGSANGADAYLVDDAGKRGGLASGAAFIILGDLNAEPYKGEKVYGSTAIAQLLDHPRVQDPCPESAGAVEGGSPGPPLYRERRTCNFGRIDYVLPSVGLKVLDSGVYWPPAQSPRAQLMTDRKMSSDHRLVWVDLEVP
jgi:endonuclease/exonuclease/phosphatase family metal-dependent hydrolase